MLNNDIISDIASQLGHFEFAGQKNKGGVESNFEIEESLEIWFIDINDLNDSTKKVDSIIKPSGKWHLQVFNNGKPTHYARIAINKKSKKWYVTSFFESTLAGSINTGLE